MKEDIDNTIDTQLQVRASAKHKYVDSSIDTVQQASLILSHVGVRPLSLVVLQDAVVDPIASQNTWPAWKTARRATGPAIHTGRHHASSVQ